MAKLPNGFQVWDYIVFLLTILISLGIGVFFAVSGGGQNTKGEYLLGGRSMSIVPVAISMLVSFQSAILILGVPAEMYMQGTEFFTGVLGNVSAIICCAIFVVPLMYPLRFTSVLEGTEYFSGEIGICVSMVFGAIFVVPLMYPLRLTSTLEYLERRYRSRAVRLFGTFVTIITQIFYMGVASFAPAIALEAVTGIRVWISLLVAGGVVTIYTSIGGIKAVIWTDMFQAIIMVGGMVAILIQGTLKVGGFTEVWETNEKWERIRFFTVDLDPRVRHTVFGNIIGNGLGGLGYGFMQTIVQRYCTLPTLRKAQITVLVNMVAGVIPVAIACYTGIVMFAYYADQNVNLLSQGVIDNSNQLIIYFVMDILAYPTVPGFFMASLFAGALSSMSSSMNALGAITWEDLLKPSLEARFSEASRTFIIKLIVAVYGCLSIGISYVMTYVDGTVTQAITMMHSPLSGALSAVFLLGALLPFVNKYGALVGGVVGAGIATWQAVGSFVGGVESLFLDLPYPNGTFPVNASWITEEFATSNNATSDSMSYLWLGLMSMVICSVVAIIVSLCTRCLIPDDEREVPTMYQIPVMTRVFGCFPKSWLYYLDCCREFDTPEEILEERLDAEKRAAASESEIGGGEHTNPENGDLCIKELKPEYSSDGFEYRPMDEEDLALNNGTPVRRVTSLTISG